MSHVHRHKPHQGKREIARRRVQILRKQLGDCCRKAGKMSWNDQVDLGYVDGAEDLLGQIMALMPLAYGRKNLNAPRRVWVSDNSDEIRAREERLKERQRLNPNSTYTSEWSLFRWSHQYPKRKPLLRAYKGRHVPRLELR